MVGDESAGKKLPAGQIGTLGVDLTDGRSVKFLHDEKKSRGAYLKPGVATLGDIGFIDGVDLDSSELTAIFDGRPVTYDFGELDMLVPAYAATIHKSQGSEYPAVVIPIMTQHYAMLQRNLLYTGVTRGKRLVVLVGQRKAIAIAVRSVSGRRRWSKLREWLS